LASLDVRMFPDGVESPGPTQQGHTRLREVTPEPGRGMPHTLPSDTAKQDRTSRRTEPGLCTPQRQDTRRCQPSNHIMLKIVAADTLLTARSIGTLKRGQQASRTVSGVWCHRATTVRPITSEGYQIQGPAPTNPEEQLAASETAAGLPTTISTTLKHGQGLSSGQDGREAGGSPDGSWDWCPASSFRWAALQRVCHRSRASKGWHRCSF